MKYQVKPRMVAAARYTDRYGTVERAEFEGFCLLHRLTERVHRVGRRRSAPAPPDWTEIYPNQWHPWVVVDTAHGTTTVRQLADKEFSSEFEPAEQAPDARREALITWARYQVAHADAVYLRRNASDLEREPWTDPVLRAERERITALVTVSGLSYDETPDPQNPDRQLREPIAPASFRVTADAAAVLQVLLSHPGEQLTCEAISRQSGQRQGKAGRVLWQLNRFGWATTTEPGAGTWSLTETGVTLGRERLARRAK